MKNLRVMLPCNSPEATVSGRGESLRGNVTGPVRGPAARGTAGTTEIPVTSKKSVNRQGRSAVYIGSSGGSSIRLLTVAQSVRDAVHPDAREGLRRTGEPVPSARLLDEPVERLIAPVDQIEQQAGVQRGVAATSPHPVAEAFDAHDDHRE